MKKAIAEGKRAMALSPNDAMVLHLYALVLFYAGRPEEAIPLYQKAIRRNPNGPGFFFLHLGHAQYRIGRFDEAVLAYKKAIQRSPNNIIAHTYLDHYIQFDGPREGSPH